MVGAQDAGRIVRGRERPIGAVDADDLLRLDPVPERQPAIVGQDRRRPAADARGGHRVGMRADARASRCGFQWSASGEVARLIDGPGAPVGSRRIGEIEIAQRAGLRPILAVDPALEDQHVLVLMVEHDVLEAPVEAVLRTVERRRMALGADRAGCHQPAVPDAADPRVLEAIALRVGVRRNGPVIVDRDRWPGRPAQVRPAAARQEVSAMMRQPPPRTKNLRGSAVSHKVSSGQAIERMARPASAQRMQCDMSVAHRIGEALRRRAPSSADCRWASRVRPGLNAPRT